MNKEDRKEYNKKYYSANKNAIIEKHYKRKCNCELCGRLVSVANIEKHYESTLCKKRSVQKHEIRQRLEALTTKDYRQTIL
jgi:hypothetical protein